MINHIFRDMLDQGTISFMDDIVVTLHPTLEARDEIALEVLRRLRDNNLCIAPAKCEWAKDRIEFLGYIAPGDGVEMIDEKAQTRKDFELVNTLKDAQHFLGFANFYRRFIKDYSKLVLPLTNSTSLPAHE